MDKYTYNVKAEKIQKLVKKGEYAAAVKIAETVDWEEVHSVRLLTITAAAYERVRDYKGAIELLQMAYDESAVGKRILYKLTGLAIADRDVELAQNYYEMYLQNSRANRWISASRSSRRTESTSSRRNGPCALRNCTTKPASAMPA